MSSYNQLAYIYDSLMNHIDYSEVTEYYIKAAQKHGWQGGIVLDLACGTGNITLELLKKGYTVHGLDNSSDMLSVADEKIYGAGYTPHLFCQDMKDFQVIDKYELVISAFDSMNYLLNEDDVNLTIKNVSEALKDKGFFLFDVHSEYKIKEVLGQNIFTYTDDDIAYIWQNYYSAEEEVCDMDIDVFVSNDDGTYERIREFHQERYYSREELEKILQVNGFETLAVYGDYTMEAPSACTERLFYVSRKL